MNEDEKMKDEEHWDSGNLHQGRQLQL